AGRHARVVLAEVLDAVACRRETGVALAYRARHLRRAPRLAGCPQRGVVLPADVRTEQRLLALVGVGALDLTLALRHRRARPVAPLRLGRRADRVVARVRRDAEPRVEIALRQLPDEARAALLCVLGHAVRLRNVRSVRPRLTGSGV